MKTMEFCSGSMLHGFQGNPWNFPHAFSMVFPWFSHAFSTRGSILHENVSNIVWDELRLPTNIFLDFFQVCLFGKTGPERKSEDASDQGGNVPVFSHLKSVSNRET